MICYTDGACSGNPGPGGFGIVILDDNENYIDSYQQFAENTTNNRMELSAILHVMITYGKDKNPPIVYSDSAYAVNTLTSWMWNWEKNGWVKNDNKTPENLDLIQMYYDYWRNGHRIELRKCWGHAGIHWNEIADKLARAARDHASQVNLMLLKRKEIVDATIQ